MKSADRNSPVLVPVTLSLWSEFLEEKISFKQQKKCISRILKIVFDAVQGQFPAAGKN